MSFMLTEPEKWAVVHGQASVKRLTLAFDYWMHAKFRANKLWT